jgi:GMP synthase (glutamine-hydrolysing)
LLARALGATVQKSPWPHIGWARLRVTPAAKSLFGSTAQVLTFNWHYETFSIPQGATRTLFGEHCLNKGFVHGRHLAFQSHLEVTEEIVRACCAAHHAELAVAAGPDVQNDAEILSHLDERLAVLHEAARRVYTRWSAQWVRPPHAVRVGG